MSLSYFSPRKKKSKKTLIIENVRTHHDESYTFDLDKILGEGGQGCVRLAKNQEKSFAAVKIYDASHSTLTSDEDLKREYKILKTLDRFIGAAAEENCKYIFMDYYPGESLLFFLYDIDKNSEEYYVSKKEIEYVIKISLLILVIGEIIDLHEKGILHHDIKSDNFIFDTKSFQLRIIDFGSAITVGTEDRSLTGTFCYVAPELVDAPSTEKRPLYNYACDEFSLGIVLAEIFTQKNFQKMRIDLNKEFKGAPAPSNSIKALMPDIFDTGSDEYLLKNLIPPKAKILNRVLEIIHWLTMDDPALRPNLSELKKIQKELETIQEDFKKLEEELKKQEVDDYLKRFEGRLKDIREVKRGRTLSNVKPAVSFGTLVLPPFPLVEDSMPSGSQSARSHVDRKADRKMSHDLLLNYPRSAKSEHKKKEKEEQKEEESIVKKKKKRPKKPL